MLLIIKIIYSPIFVSFHLALFYGIYKDNEYVLYA